MIDEGGHVAIIMNNPSTGSDVVYCSHLTMTADRTDERILSEKLSFVVFENDPGYKELVVGFIKGKSAFPE